MDSLHHYSAGYLIYSTPGMSIAWPKSLRILTL